MPGPRAGSGVGKYNAESSKQGSKRFKSIAKTIHYLVNVISFDYVHKVHRAGRSLLLALM